MAQAGSALHGVSKRFSRRGPWVLNGVDLELPPGSRTVIVGGNGSGKSTLLRIGARVSHPSRGDVTMACPIGYVPEKLAARVRMTGADYLAHMGGIKGLDRATIRGRAERLLGRLDLQPGSGVPVDSLSKGNRQKLVLAQAFLGPVALLVLDEPFSGLDPVGHGALRELMQEAQAEGTAIIESAHRLAPEHVGIRQLRIERGDLTEIDREVTARREGREMVVELVPSAGLGPHDEIISLPGVTSGALSPPGDVLVLRTEAARVDHVLTAAIALGWSVRSVQPFDPPGPPT